MTKNLLTRTDLLVKNRHLEKENAELLRKNSALQTDKELYKTGMKNWQEAHKSLTYTVRSLKLDLDAYRRLYTFLTLNKAELDARMEKESISDRMGDLYR